MPNRTPLYAGAAVLYVVTTLAIVFGTIAISTADDEPPVYSSSIEITNRIDGIDGIALRVGEPFAIVTEPCNRSDEVVTVTASATLIQTDVDPNRVVLLFGGLGRPVMPGCNRSEVSLPMPPEVTPGVWTLQSVSRVAASDSEQDVLLVVSNITVVP